MVFSWPETTAMLLWMLVACMKLTEIGLHGTESFRVTCSTRCLSMKHTTHLAFLLGRNKVYLLPMEMNMHREQRAAWYSFRRQATTGLSFILRQVWQHGA